MLEFWKSKAPKQSAWFTKHPAQVMKQANRVWHWSIQAGDGRAWVYFIFAVCQWLPTNHRLFYEDKSPYCRDICHLCSLGEIEDMEHLWKCPAFDKERLNLRSSILAKIAQWKLPFSNWSVGGSEDRILKRLISFCQQEDQLSLERRKILALDFWKTNNQKSSFPFSSFLPNLRRVASNCSWIQNHIIPDANFSLNTALSELLARNLHLSVEANTSSLSRSPLFYEWCSLDVKDAVFGSAGSFMEAPLSGKNVLLVYEQKMLLPLSYEQGR